MQITKDVLTDLGVSSANADEHLGPLNDGMSRYGINTLLRIAHFLAQVVHESAHLKAVSENLNYSADGLLKVFPRHFKTRAEADRYARKPEKIANRVYANRMGNGNEASGDGYRYRGRGLIQLTGKNNYRAFSRWVGHDCVADPDQVASAYAALSGIFYWDANGLNALADTDNLVAMTRRINGGLNGFADRRALLQKAKRSLGRLPAGPSTAAPVLGAAWSAGSGGETAFAPTHRVVPAGLNLRSAPNRDRSTRIATLSQGTAVEQLGASDHPGWLRVRALLNGMARDGFVAARFVTPLPRSGAGTTAAGAPFEPTHRVATAALNLRSKPSISASTRIALLPQDTKVERLGEAGVPGWVMVRTMLNGVLREGLVAARYLAPLPEGAVAFSTETDGLAGITIPMARMTADHLETVRTRDGGRLYPLGEAGRPKVTASSPVAQAEQLLDIIRWLDCENPEHKRYQAKGRANHASTYVGDYCDLAGIYLPRVWWTGDALARIAQEQKVEVAYDRTVRELSTNGLFDWLTDHGTQFGWHREIDLIVLQEAANAGEVCLIVARSADLSRPGHIVAVVPEHEGCRAKRDRDGDVLRPVESYCGSRNVRCATARTAWWLAGKYQSYAFWRHPLGDSESI
jgi:predicted chitinase